MEIDIKIKLEDQDITLLIKSLFEILKKLPQDNINVNINPNTKPYKHSDGTVGDPRPFPPSITSVNDHIYHKDGTINTAVSNIDTDQDGTIYFSNNGKSVKKIEEEEKKNEEN